MPTVPTTLVMFRVFRDGRREVIALFPHEPYDRSGREVMSYMHTGQHGAASMSLVGRTRPATPAEYAPLKRELESIGYKLRVVARTPTRGKRGTRETYGDSRTGVPMYRARQYARVSILIEEKGHAPRYMNWRGSSKKSIMAAARKAYPGAKLSPGNVTWHTY